VNILPVPRFRRPAGERGFGLVETLVALAVTGSAVTAFVLALSTGSIAVNEQQGQAVVQELAQSQLEYVKSYPYDAGASTYPAVPAPPGYEVQVAIAPVPGGDAAIQAVTVTVFREGTSQLTVTEYKVNR
jgi:type II secretory pathway pseudopilin PulG